MVRLELTARALRYRLWWVDDAPAALRFDGSGELSLAAGRLDRRTLARELGEVIRDVRRRQSEALAAAAQAPAAIAAPRTELLFGALAATALLFCLPLLVALITRVSLGRSLRLRSQRTSALVLVVAALAVAALAATGELITETPATVFMLGGLSWGALAVVLVPIALPPLAGLSRVEYAELFTVLDAWFSAAWRRTLALGAVVFALGWAGRALAAHLALSPQLTWGLAMPLFGLVVWHAGRAAIDVMAARIDDVLVDARTSDAWHHAVAGYVRGYFRRAGLDEPEGLLDGVRFLPGQVPGVAVYGGGLAISRIVVDRSLLEHTLAPYGRPHDYAAPRVSTLHWMQWNAGLITPSEVGTAVANRSQRRPRELTVEGDADHQPLGEPITLAGLVEPARLDPRPSYRPHDDIAWLAWDHGEEHDGTDASDKDWLFGALVVALGAIHRGEDRGATLRQLWRTRNRRRLEGDVEVAPPSEVSTAVPPGESPTVTDRMAAVAQDFSRRGTPSGRLSAPQLRVSAPAIVIPPGGRPTVERAAMRLSAPAIVIPPPSATPLVESAPAPIAEEAEDGAHEELALLPRKNLLEDDANEPRLVDGTKQFAAVVVDENGVVIEPAGVEAEAADAIEPPSRKNLSEDDANEPRLVDGTKQFAAMVVDEDELGEPRMVDGTRELAVIDPAASGQAMSEPSLRRSPPAEQPESRVQTAEVLPELEWPASVSPEIPVLASTDQKSAAVEQSAEQESSTASSSVEIAAEELMIPTKRVAVTMDVPQVLKLESEQAASLESGSGSGSESGSESGSGSGSGSESGSGSGSGSESESESGSGSESESESGSLAAIAAIALPSPPSPRRRAPRAPPPPAAPSSLRTSPRRKRASIAPPSFAPPAGRGPFSSLARHILSFWDRGAVRLGDTQTALHSARHHLVQALAFSLWQRDELLTARGHQPELERTTAAVYLELAAAPPQSPEERFLLARLRWLEPLALRGVATSHPRPRRRGLLALALAALLAWLGLSIAESVQFRSTYEQRIPAAAAPLEERSRDHGH